MTVFDALLAPVMPILQDIEQQDVQEYTRLVVRAANRVVDLTNEVIVAAQLDRNEYKPAVERFDLLSLIESVVALLPGGDPVGGSLAKAQEPFLSELRKLYSDVA